MSEYLDENGAPWPEKSPPIRGDDIVPCTTCGEPKQRCSYHTPGDCIRYLSAQVRRARLVIAALHGVTEGARLPAKWMVDHADRANKYDRPYAVEALRHVVAARDIAHEYLRSTAVKSSKPGQ